MSLVFITQSCFKVPKDFRLSTVHVFTVKIPNKRELKQSANNHSSDIDPKNFMNLYKKYIAKLYSFLVINATLAWDILLCFKRNLYERI